MERRSNRGRTVRITEGTLARLCPRRGIGRNRAEWGGMERNLIDFGRRPAGIVRSGGAIIENCRYSETSLEYGTIPLNDNEITESTTVSPLLGGRRFPRIMPRLRYVSAHTRCVSLRNTRVLPDPPEIYLTPLLRKQGPNVSNLTYPSKHSS